jgi:hypothetical protein
MSQQRTPSRLGLLLRIASFLLVYGGGGGGRRWTDAVKRSCLVVNDELILEMHAPWRRQGLFLTHGSDSRLKILELQTIFDNRLTINDLSSKVHPNCLCTNLLYLPLDNNFRVIYIPAELNPNQVNAYPA